MNDNVIHNNKAITEQFGSQTVTAQKIVTPPMPTILIDDRDNQAFHFCGIWRNGKKLEVKTQHRRLAVGSYTLEGFEGRIGIKRMASLDLISSLTHGSKSLVAELEALNKFDLFAACVVEGHFQAVAEAKFYGLQVNRESIIESVAMLATHLRNLQWFFLRDRQAAADVTFSLLQKAHWVFSKNNKNTSGIAVPEAKL